MKDETLIGSLICRKFQPKKFEEDLEKLIANDLLDKYEEYELGSIIAGNISRYNLTSEFSKFYSDQKIDEVDKRIQALYEASEEIVCLLNKHSIDCLLLKNSAIGKISKLKNYENPMGDIDFLIRKKDLHFAQEILCEAGHVLIDSQYDKHMPKHEFETTLTYQGFHHRFEFQTRPVSGRWLGIDQEPSEEEIFASVRKIEGTIFSTLSPELLLITVALHTAKHSYVRAPGFRLHTDVDRLVTDEIIDWTKFIHHAKRFNVTVPVYFSLYLASIFLSTPVPGEVLRELQPGYLRRTFILKHLKNVGFLNPNKKKWGQVAYITFVLALYDGIHQMWRNLYLTKSDIERRYGKVKIRSQFIFNFKRILNIITKRKNH